MSRFEEEYDLWRQVETPSSVIRVKAMGKVRKTIPVAPTGRPIVPAKIPA